MASILQDFGLIEAVLGDIAAFAAGQPVSATQKIGNSNVTVSVVTLPNGPAGTPYQVFTGSFFQILSLVLTDASVIAGGGSIQIAEKIGNTFYGITASIKAA